MRPSAHNIPTGARRRLHLAPIYTLSLLQTLTKPFCCVQVNVTVTHTNNVIYHNVFGIILIDIVHIQYAKKANDEYMYVLSETWQKISRLRAKHLRLDDCLSIIG